MRGAGSMEAQVSNTMRARGTIHSTIILEVWVSNTMRARGTVHSAVTLVDEGG